MRQQREALTQTFGTKQAIRSARSQAENALLSDAKGKPGAAESALLSSMPSDAAKASDRDKEVQAAKPIPKANLSATTPAEAYSIQSLVPNGSVTLRTLNVKDWEDAISSGNAVTSTSRFVARRVEGVVKSGNKQNLRLLRFVQILIEFARCLKPARAGPDNKAGPGSKKLPAREDLRRILSASPKMATDDGTDEQSSANYLSDHFIDSLRRCFVPQGSLLSRTDIILLHTTICALTLHIPPTANGFPSFHELATDPADLRDDLRLDSPVVQQYFRELGCIVDKPRESEFAAWGVKTKSEAAAKRIARLRLPLKFPKPSRGGRR